MHSKLKYLLLFILPLSLMLTSCDDDDDTPKVLAPGSLTLDIHNNYNSSALALSQEYTTSGNTRLNFSQLRYIISNVKLVADDDTEHAIPDSYYVIEKTPTAERGTVELTDIPAGTYKAITFSVGVDEPVNHSLDLAAGDLKTAQGMSWSWNTGYKFVVAEGQVFDSGTGTWADYKYHIGTDANYRTLTLQLPAPIQVNSQRDSEIMLVAMLQNLFNQVDVAQYRVVMSGTSTATVATQVADNYASMFMVHHAHSMQKD